MRTIAVEYKAKGQMHFCELGAPPDLKPPSEGLPP